VATARRPPLRSRAPRPNQENIAPPPPSLGPAEAPTVPSGDNEVGEGEEEEGVAAARAGRAARVTLTGGATRGQRLLKLNDLNYVFMGHVKFQVS
jgi:hypothetical protein